MNKWIKTLVVLGGFVVVDRVIAKAINEATKASNRRVIEKILADFPDRNIITFGGKK
jgi:1-acyl-sn-glycerol-3-phosphate acyltransferase